MPWYYRTFSSWIEELRASRLDLVSCVEPLNQETGDPLSLLLSCALADSSIPRQPEAQ
jgi:hypothetical protein